MTGLKEMKEWAQTKDFLEGILNSLSAVSIILTDFDQNILFLE